MITSHSISHLGFL